MKDDPNDLPGWLVPPLGSPFDSPPPSVSVEVEVGAQSRRGPMRSTSEDQYLILRLGRHEETLLTSLPESQLPARLDEYGYGMVVADGIGPSGDQAARMAISALVHLAIYFGKWHVRVDDGITEEMMDRAQRFYRSVNATLLHGSPKYPRGLRTAMTAIYSVDAELFFVHVGNSCAYLFRDDRLLPLTPTHTSNADRPCRPALPLGARSQGVPQIDVEHCSLLDRDVVLLCTDGLTDRADDARIADTLRAHRTPDEQCRALVDFVADFGGIDDVTALIAHYRIRPRSAAAV